MGSKGTRAVTGYYRLECLGQRQRQTRDNQSGRSTRELIAPGHNKG